MLLQASLHAYASEEQLTLYHVLLQASKVFIHCLQAGVQKETAARSAAWQYNTQQRISNSRQMISQIDCQNISGNLNYHLTLSG